MSDSKAVPPTRRLADTINRLLRSEVTNGYTTLSPRIDSDNVVVIKVKDSRESSNMTITIRESN